MCGTNNANNQIPAQISVLRASATPTMTSSQSSITCGSTIPITFTISNISNLSGITGYEWNLGNNNGWIFNGIIAPPQIITTTNTLNLTPNCGLSQSAPTANIIVNNSGSICNINVPASVFSITPPSLSIQGNQSLCSGTENYTLIGSPCNSNILWSISPQNSIATLNTITGPNTSLTRVSDGDITLTAIVESCGNEYTVTLPIHVGPYGTSNYILTGGGSTTQPLLWCPNQTYAFAVNGLGSNYQWTIPSGWSINYQSNYLCIAKAPTSTYPPTGSVSVTFNEPCGNIVSKSFFTAYSQIACTGTDPRFTFSPNPAPYYLNVGVVTSYIGSVVIKKIQLIQSSTGIMYFDQNYGSGVNSAYITTSGFPTGTYSLRIFDGNTWAIYQVVK